MTRIIFYLLAMMAIPSWCSAEVTRLPEKDRQALKDVSRFREIHTVTNLPQAVVTLCADHKGRMADPGQKWQVSDAIIDDRLPERRLIWAATDDDYYVVHYESGGFAHTYHILVARLKRGDEKATFVWHGVGKPLKDFKAFAAAIANNKLDDELDYVH